MSWAILPGGDFREAEGAASSCSRRGHANLDCPLGVLLGKAGALLCVCCSSFTKPRHSTVLRQVSDHSAKYIHVNLDEERCGKTQRDVSPDDSRW